MTYKNSVKLHEYKLNNVYSSRKASPNRANYEKAKILRQTVSEIRMLQTYRPAIVFDGPYRLDVAVYGATSADEDNIRKAINDALQGCATKNDRYSKGGSIELCRSEIK